MDKFKREFLRAGERRKDVLLVASKALDGLIDKDGHAAPDALKRRKIIGNALRLEMEALQSHLIKECEKHVISSGLIVNC